MTPLAEKILANLATLPPEMQKETLNFIQFLQTKWAKINSGPQAVEANGVALAELLKNSAQKIYL